MSRSAEEWSLVLDPTGYQVYQDLTSRVADRTLRIALANLALTDIAGQIELQCLACLSSWTICSSVPLQVLPRLKSLFSLVCMRDRPISIPVKVRLAAVFPSLTP